MVLQSAVVAIKRVTWRASPEVDFQVFIQRDFLELRIEPSLGKVFPNCLPTEA